MKNIGLFTAVLIFVASCTELNEPKMHPADWTSANSEHSHMIKISISGIEGCKDCHGGIEKSDYHGGTSGVSCYECHAGGPSGHPAYKIWIGSSENPDFHGNREKSRCELCHGNDLNGGVVSVSCYICHETF